MARNIKEELTMEASLLEDKVEKLENFLNNPDAENIVGEDQYKLLDEQVIFMTGYLNILDDRIALL